MKDIADWQHRYHAQPGVWTVRIGSGEGEETGNLYASQEAAEVEVAYRRSRGTRTARATFLGNLHDLTLAKDRWER